MIFIPYLFFNATKYVIRKSIRSNNCLPEASRNWLEGEYSKKVTKNSTTQYKLLLFLFLYFTIWCTMYNWRHTIQLVKTRFFFYFILFFLMYNLKWNWQQSHLFMCYLWKWHIFYLPFSNRIHSCSKKIKNFCT